MLRRTSLAFATALWTALAAAMAMALYGAVEYASGTAGSGADVALRHAIHVLVVAVATYVVLYFALRRAVVLPIRRVTSHLYGVATGHVDDLRLDGGTAEIVALFEGVNRMVSRIRMRFEDGDAGRLNLELEQLRVLARDLTEQAPAAAEEILVRVDGVERTVLGQMISAPPPPLDSPRR